MPREGGSIRTASLNTRFISFRSNFEAFKAIGINSCCEIEILSGLFIDHWQVRINFIPTCSTVCEPLSRLTSKDIEFHWDEEQENAFKKLKAAPTLGFPAQSAKLSLFMDASDVGVGAVLIQETDDKKKVLAFLSK
ncbi:hypothetical protein ADUPG1_008214 [Aduncisulcus paluster]|uniref:Reverse transcriptase/retrotransposon-derived protein RNase H-like domain-containing protein n=1 Tax=Aduncisulcus paluster TaxID=2918883 RepID=A0ABQ5KSH5_9EUKA|nr:hypothetical protein ADUPG1_008214 [Aduncisulcus paluster]